MSHVRKSDAAQLFYPSIVSGNDNALSNGIAHQLCTGMQVELVHDILAMASDGFGADGKANPDFGVALTFGQMRKHFLFPGCKPVQRP